MTDPNHLETHIKNALLQKEYFPALLDAIPDLIFIKGIEGRYLGCNKAFEAFTGLSEAQIINMSDIDIFSAKNATIFRKHDQMVFISGKRQTFEECVEYPENKKHFFETIRTPLHDSDGNIIGIVGIARDITPKKEAEERIRQKLCAMVKQRTQELEETHNQLLHAEKLAAIGRLSASIAHEFNNPLYGVMNVLNGLRDIDSISGEDRELLEMAIVECKRMQNLIVYLKDFYLPSQGKFEPSDIHSLIENVLLLYRNCLNKRKITVRNAFAQDMPQTYMVKDQIKQVLLNLISNAMDACKSDEGIISIKTSCNNNKIMVAIKDNGVGISEDNISRIFEPFFTTKPAVSGTGLGLAISYGIVKKHKGDIEVKSQTGEGATFTVTLPLRGEEGELGGCDTGC